VSITITTDVFCGNFEADCSQWINGVTGEKPNAKGARQVAKRLGWRHIGGRDLCADCAKAAQPKDINHGQ
jgi:hypothetical protein